MDFQLGFKAGDVDRWKEKAYRSNSTAYRTVHHWLAAQPEMRKWVGARIINNLVSRSFELKNEDWEYTFSVDTNDIFYDNLGAYEDRARVAGDTASRWYEKVVTDAMIAANVSLAWDGQTFYNAAHPVNYDDSGAGTYANSFTAMPLTSANLWTLIATMMSFKNENGLPMEVMPTLLEVPPQLGIDGATALASGINLATVQALTVNAQAGGNVNVAAAGVENRVPTALAAIGGALKLIINPRLSAAPTVWYVHSTNLLKPFIIQVAQDPSPLLQITDPQNPEIFHNKRFIYGTDAKGVAAGTLPFLSMRVSTV
jgi:phage major head subunit gpT-like protein